MNKGFSLVPKAVAWMEEHADLILESGEGLHLEEIELAKAVGVVHPESVRILEITAMPWPSDAELRQAALSAGMFGPNMVGLTLGYGIYIVQGHRNTRLVSHELRHVFQYEKAGSVADFAFTYLEQLMSFGYSNAPLEIDARNHEKV